MHKRLNKKKKSPTRKWGLLIILLLFLFLLLWMYLSKVSEKIVQKDVQTGTKDSAEIEIDIIADSSDTVMPFNDTVDTVTDIDTTVLDTVIKEVVKTKEKKIPLSSSDSDSADIPDTVKEAVQRDTFEAESEDKDPCLEIRDELWVYPDPSGGLHRTSLNVSLFSNRPCGIWYRVETDTLWKVYDKGPIVINKTGTLEYRAQDSCGNIMETRKEFYEFLKQEKSPCPDDMVHIKIDSIQYCIDRFEWPNRLGEIPLSYISLYQAMDSCFSVGRRLCTVEEWSLACAGPYSWKYPYGQMYEPYACAVQDTIVTASGAKPECRGYFGAFDMSGNLMEWTSTKSKENPEFHYIMGGFWESGPQSGCFDKRYSYYPRNRHNPVGFRCCKDLPVQDKVSGKKRRKQ